MKRRITKANFWWYIKQWSKEGILLDELWLRFKEWIGGNKDDGET